MFYLENNTTFSGADIKVYAYRDIKDFSTFKDKDLRKAKQNNQNPLYPNDPFADQNPNDLDVKLQQSLADVGSGKAFGQKNITTPDGKSSTINVNDLPAIQQQYAAPVVTDFPAQVNITYPSGTRRTIFESELDSELDKIKQSYPDHDPEIFNLPNQKVITRSDGSEEVVLADEAASILQDHKPLVIKDAEDKVNYDKVQTNKVNPNYIDIVKQGGDKQALKLARDYRLAQINKNRNDLFDKDGHSMGHKPIIEFGSLYSITYSSFREKHAVRTLGRVSAKDYTKGQRTIAGSMNFAVFQSHELMDFLKPTAVEDNIVILDQLPKFNLMLIMINEYGGASILHLFGVTISTESQQTSVEDLALMNNITFYAEDIMTIENVGNIFETSLSMLHPTVIAGRTLRFYKKNEFTTLSGLLSINGDTTNNKIQGLINRSRGLF